MRSAQRAGLSPRSEEIVRVALPNTLFAVVIEDRGSAVGMGRVVGDGGTVFQVADIAVLPEHQGRGLGKQILDAIDAWLRQTARPGAFVNLFADRGVAPLYARYGFRPARSRRAGNVLRGRIKTLATCRNPPVLPSSFVHWQ